MDTLRILPVETVEQGWMRFSFVRVALATLAICLPVALVLVLSNQIPDKALRAFWPPLLASLCGYAGYLFYVRKAERRAHAELQGPRAGRELGAGLLLGGALFLAVLAILGACGSYRLVGAGAWIGMAKSLTEMLMIALLEELLFRGVLQRIPERSLGSWGALILSSLLFALAHLPNEHITIFAVANTLLAGLMFGAAFLATRRLWLAIGMHFAWNFLSDGVFALPTSGNPGRGWLVGELSGPQWLSGGGYGLEASSVTFIVMALVTALLLRHAIRAGHLVPRGGKTER